MGYIVRDTNPQYGGGCYFVGNRRIVDPQGRHAEAADFGDKANAKQFSSKSMANEIAKKLNHMAGSREQFIVEELSIYGQQYGKRATRKSSNGFRGFGTLPSEEPQPSGGFVWKEPTGGYNGF